jgi:hypothetical protein
MHDKILIVKATGEKEPFLPHKLRESLAKVERDNSVIEKILSHIEIELKDGMTTKEIYRHAFDLLKKERRPSAIRYSLRNAVMEMGPTGFPFELLVAEIFRAKGFETSTDFFARGKCVEHEIDVVAWNANKLIMVEAKFHNQFGIKSDLKAALYVKARWEDLESEQYNFGGMRKLDEGWLVTNTKFSEQAIKYARCRNMRLVGWNYPESGNLQDLIEDMGLHPITSLQSISAREKRVLMESGVVLCKHALENQDILAQAGIPKNKIERVLKEIKEIQGS